MNEIINLVIAAVLVMLSGLFSGLNLGLMSFSDEDLRIIIEGSPEEQERKDAARIQPLRKKGNLLLCTLLLGNTLVNAMIAILLSGMTSGVVGGARRRRRTIGRRSLTATREPRTRSQVW